MFDKNKGISKCKNFSRYEKNNEKNTICSYKARYIPYEYALYCNLKIFLSTMFDNCEGMSSACQSSVKTLLSLQLFPCRRGHSTLLPSPATQQYHPGKIISYNNGNKEIISTEQKSFCCTSSSLSEYIILFLQLHSI